MKTSPRHAGVLALLAGLALAAAPANGQIPRAPRRPATGPSPEVARLLARVDSTKAEFRRATWYLIQSSYVMEAVVATEERRAELRRELASADSLEQRGGEHRVQLDAVDRATRLEQATAERRFEQSRLSDAQVQNVTSAAFNTALAVLKDREALEEARRLIDEAQRAAQSIANDPAQAAHANRLRTAATQDLPAIVNTVPQQLRLATVILGAVGQARSANQTVQVLEPAGRSDRPRPIAITDL